MQAICCLFKTDIVEMDICGNFYAGHPEAFAEGSRNLFAIYNLVISLACVRDSPRLFTCSE
jgi:hypothetical protein